jgi:capsular polysaccharide transport system permease protein
MSSGNDGRVPRTGPAKTANPGATPPQEFATALRNWLVIMGFLVREQLKAARGKAGRAGLLIAIAEPFALIVMFYMIRGLIRGTVQDYGTSLFLFLASGLLPYYLFLRTSIVTRRGRAGPGRRLPRINSLDTFMAAVATQALIWIPVIAIVFLGMVMYGIQEARPASIATCAYALFLMLTLGAGFGLVNLSIGRFLSAWPVIIALATRGMLFLSGVIHIPDFLYPSVREWLAWNPLLQGVTLFRLGVYGEYPTLLFDEGYLLKCTIAFMFVGLVVDRATLRYESR